MNLSKTRIESRMFGEEVQPSSSSGMNWYRSDRLLTLLHTKLLSVLLSGAEEVQSVVIRMSTMINQSLDIPWHFVLKWLNTFEIVDMVLVDMGSHL